MLRFPVKRDLVATASEAITGHALSLGDLGRMNDLQYSAFIPRSSGFMPGFHVYFGSDVFVKKDPSHS